MIKHAWGHAKGLSRTLQSPKPSRSYSSSTIQLKLPQHEAQLLWHRCFSSNKQATPTQVVASRILEAARNQQHSPCKALSSPAARSVCNCALASDTMKPIIAPQPGTVAQYAHHVMLRIPQPAGHSSPDNSIWWPPVMEK